MVASVRIANYVAQQLGAPLVHTEEDVARCTDEQLQALDLFVLVNSPTGFAPEAVRRFSAEGLWLARNAVFVNNDYKMRPPSQSKSHQQRRWGKHRAEAGDYYGYSLWSTVPGQLRPARYPLDSYVNWNQLTYEPRDGMTHVDREPGVLYWGALRKGREGRLRQLLHGQFPVTVSTAPQSVQKFKEFLPNANYVGQLNPLIAALTRYRATIYTHDDWSDTAYCSLANRFYEALSAGMAILVDARCTGTFKRAGLSMEPEWIVRSHDDVARALANAERIAVDQVRWREHYQTLLKEQLHAAVAKVSV